MLDLLLLCALSLRGQGRDLDSLGYAEIESPAAMLATGPWRAWLDSPGGELPFALEIAHEGKGFAATIGNGEERIAVPATRVDGDEVVFDIPHYDASITAKVAPLGTRLDGEWKKRSGVDRWTTLKFHAEAGEAPRFKSDTPGKAVPVAGRWAVKFEHDADPAVAILRSAANGTVEGTFLTSTGDFRWLAGTSENARLRLSCFDGAHAFLFDAKLAPDGLLAGDFWSGDRGHDTWSALRNDRAAIPDEFERAHWKEGFGLAQLSYPDLEGVEHSLGEDALAGRAMVIQVLGSWCPNCHDETAYLARVYDKYKDRGLSVVGLAFELTGDFARDAEQVRRMRERHKAKYPFLLAGLADKGKAAEALPALDHVIGFPTTIFLHRDGRVRAVHSGFAGPGTQQEYQKLATQFEKIVEELIAEADVDDAATWKALTAEEWRGKSTGLTIRFADTGRGKGATIVGEADRSKWDPTTSYPVVIRGSTISIADKPWSFDSARGEIVDASDFTRRLTSAAHPEAAAPVDLTRLASDPDVMLRTKMACQAGEQHMIDAGASLVTCTKHGFAPLRREAARAIGAIGYNAGAEALHALESDIDPLVRDVATKALAQLSRK